MATRLQARTDVLNIADAYNSPRWDATPGGEIDRRLGMVHIAEWKKILQAATYYQTANYTPTTDATGTIPRTLLVGGSGDALQQPFRVLSVFVGNQEYQYADARRWIQSVTLPIQANVWYWNGSSIVLAGAPSTTASIWVNWYPQRFDQLANDASVVALPPDYDDVFNYEGAAALLTKGAAETEAAAELSGIAQRMRADYFDALQRLSIDPQTIAYSDGPSDWGG